LPLADQAPAHAFVAQACIIRTMKTLTVLLGLALASPVTAAQPEPDLPHAFDAGGSWSTATLTVHEAVNIGDTTTSYLVVEPVPQ